MVCMLNEHCAAVCLETTDDDIVAVAQVEEDRDHSGELPAKPWRSAAMSWRWAMTACCRRLGAKDLNGKMRAAGFKVYDPDMTMFTWAGGGVHCMCQPLRRDAA